MPMVAATEDMLMITPPTGDCASICRTPSRAQRKTPPAFTRITVSQSCRLVSRIVPTWLMPALLTRISSRPSVAATRSIAALTWDSSRTSSCCERVLPPAARISLATRSAASTLISVRMTCAPCCAKSRAICSPMPDPAPVTKAIFLSKRNTCASFLPLVCMEHFLHRSPPLAGSPRRQRCLHRLGQGPPLARLRVRGHLRRIGLVIVAGIFKIGKEKLTMAKNAVVANVARGNHRQHFRPGGGMQAFVCFDLVWLQAYNLSNSCHCYLLSPAHADPLG